MSHICIFFVIFVLLNEEYIGLLCIIAKSNPKWTARGFLTRSHGNAVFNRLPVKEIPPGADIIFVGRSGFPPPGTANQ